MMNRSICIFLYMVLLAGFVALTACSQEEEGAALPSIGNPDLPDDDSSDIDDVPPDVVEATGFWINVISDQFVSIVNERDVWDSDCFIPVGNSESPTPETRMTCDIDLMEGDLYSHDIEIQINVPPGLCDHLRVIPPWHYNQNVGRGPREVLVIENNLADPPVAGTCQAQTDFDGLTVACSGHPELTDTTNIGGPSCIYNRSDVGLENCCFGTYSYTVEPDEDGNGVGDGVGTRTTVTRDWGGSYEGCVSPYLSNGWDTIDDDTSLPRGAITTVPKDPTTDNPIGLNTVRTLIANGDTTLVGFSTWSNFYEISSTSQPHRHTGIFYTGITSDLPYSVDPIDDLDGSLMKRFVVPGQTAFPIEGNEAWEFSCLDGGHEVRHQIRAYIREWNTLLDFIAYKTSSGTVYNPDVGGYTGGEEGTNCDYDPKFPNEVCNDYWDFDDILESVGGNYNNSANRANFFPNIVY